MFNLFTCHSNVYYSIVHSVENNCGKNILYVRITFRYHRYVQGITQVRCMVRVSICNNIVYYVYLQQERVGNESGGPVGQ